MEGYKEIAASLRSSQRQDKLAGRRHCERQRGNLFRAITTLLPFHSMAKTAAAIVFETFIGARRSAGRKHWLIKNPSPA